MKEFVTQELGDTHAYQYAIHVPRASDGLDNPHVHLMFSERRTDGIARDPDQYFKRFNAAHPERGGCQKGFGEQPGQKLTAVERKAELKALRERWGECVNAALERAGHSERVSMKSYADRGLDIQPEPKQLPSAWRGEGKAAVMAFREARAEELEARRDPGVIIERVSSMKALFTRQNLYRSLNSVTDDVEVFNEIKAQLDAHPTLVPLETGEVAGSSRELLTTREVLETERSITALGQVLSQHGSFGLSESASERALQREPRLSDEQVAAVKHVTGDAQLAIVAGVAGSGKSTMLSVVRAGYEQAGYRVSGVALAGKAADELRRSSGIESRTLASWLYRKEAGMLSLDSKDVIVMDEAGMVHNGTMNRVLDAANRGGAKVILVGDAEQLQPIQAGCPFRSLSDAHGVSRIDTVRRQSSAWQREATQALSRGEGETALSAYTQAGHVHEASEKSLVPKLVQDYLSQETGSSMILAHRKVDVAMLNHAVRDARKARGELGEVGKIGEMEIAVGDRVVFTKNDSKLGVLNGQFGEVTGFQLGGLGVTVQVDEGKSVQVPTLDYTELQHGYASTIHKSQGMTVDRAMLWGSASLDRHLGYVGMSRHRERLDVYQPNEATRVRSLSVCLSRTTRAVTVEATMVEHGLEVTVAKDGRTRLARTYPAAHEVDHAKDMMTRVGLQVNDGMAQRQAQHEAALARAEKAMAAHQAAEPPGGKRLYLSKRAHEERLAWDNAEPALRTAVMSAKGSLDQWRGFSSSREAKTQLLEEGLRRQDVDPLTPAGGVERACDGSVRITDRYPIAARHTATLAAVHAQRDAESSIAGHEQGLARAESFAQQTLDRHLQAEPTDSKFQVFMYQGPKQARDAWEAKRPELEAKVAEAKEAAAAWSHSVATEGVVEKQHWEAFKQRAPGAIAIKKMTIEADEKRAERFGALRQYYVVEKLLESTLGRSMQTAYAATRDKLVERFAREQKQERLPEQLQGRVAKHLEVQDQARTLSRSRSKGMDLGR